MDRELLPFIKEDLKQKIVLLSGPRQSGKTTLSQAITPRFDYLNYDLLEHRLLLKEKSWDRKKDLIVFDELHKMKNWKKWLKGIYDTEKIPPSLLITGSARLDIAKKMGDSLAGRYFAFRLYPFDLKELQGHLPPNEALDRILKLGSFPEPFLKGSQQFYDRWKKTHLDIILRQDLLDLESISNISGIETLIQLLRSRVGSSISYSSLARDLERDPKTVKNWLRILENFYVIFKVPPYHKNIARALLQAPKYYFYDVGQVIGDDGQKFENLVALCLLKELHFLEDTQGKTLHLNYLKNKEQQEIDFLILKDHSPSHMIETKWSDPDPSPNFKSFSKFFHGKIKKTQLVKALKREKTFPDGVEIRDAAQWLTEIEI